MDTRIAVKGKSGRERGPHNQWRSAVLCIITIGSAASWAWRFYKPTLLYADRFAVSPGILMLDDAVWITLGRVVAVCWHSRLSLG